MSLKHPIERIAGSRACKEVLVRGALKKVEESSSSKRASFGISDEVFVCAFIGWVICGDAIILLMRQRTLRM